ncbi:MAG TPA: HAD family hydrolase [Candidatus Binatia bacterium]|jgi:uncharacterized HAD superfamily protein
MDYMRTVYVDMDDVLCQTAQHFLTILERNFGKRFSFEQLTDFDVGEACEITAGEREELYRIVHQGEELLNIPPIPGAIDVLEQWSAAGYKVAIVTGRPPDTYEPSVQWLKKHRVPHDGILIVDKYGRFVPDGSRCISLEALMNHSFCWAVEDSPTMAMYLASQMKIPVALLDRPWNRKDTNHDLVSRHCDWIEIARALPGKNR